MKSLGLTKGAVAVTTLVGCGWLIFRRVYGEGREHGYHKGWLDGSRVTLATIDQSTTADSFKSRMTELMKRAARTQSNLAGRQPSIVGKWLRKGN